MATLDGNDMAGIIGSAASGTFGHYVVHSGSSQTFETPIVVSVTNYYKMRGKDVDCVSLTYRTWVVSGSPDPTGALYVGSRCGVTPFAEVVIAEAWQV